MAGGEEHMGVGTIQSPVHVVQARRIEAMTPYVRTAALSVLSALVLACGSSGGPGARGSSNVITAEELAAVEAPTVYEAVERLRPHFLRGRGTTSMRNAQPALPVVYYAGVRQGGIEMLRQLRTRDVVEVRYLNASDATTRYGTDHTGGAIVVVLR
jgi:hypothetical protein